MERHQKTPEQESSQWQVLVGEVTQRLEATSSALTALSEAIQRLTLAQPRASEPSHQPVIEQPVTNPSTAIPTRETPTSEEEARREDVRRAVEKARADMQAIWSPDSLSSVSEGSWPSGSSESGFKHEQNGHDPSWAAEDWSPEEAEIDGAEVPAMAGNPEAALEPEPAVTAEEKVPSAAAQGDTDDPAREEIRRALEQFRAELQSTGMADEPTAAQRTPAWPAGDNAWGWPSSHGDWPGGADDSQRRENRVEDASDEAGAEAGPAQITTGEQEASLNQAPTAQHEGVRDSVRRAVEQARAELHGDTAPDSEGKLEWPAHDGASSDSERFMVPASLVIEDPLGRIELARVYETLNRLDFAADASLQNYTSHSVTVGLGPSTKVPEAEVVSEAVQAAFGRSCTVTMDGTRISARIEDSAAQAA